MSKVQPVENYRTNNPGSLTNSFHGGELYRLKRKKAKKLTKVNLLVSVEVQVDN